LKGGQSPETRELQGRIEIYKLLVEMADRVSQRRQTANSFYLAVNTTIIGGSVLLEASTLATEPAWLISVGGILISMLWVFSVRSYQKLNSAKFKVISELEQRLPVQAFGDEWLYLTIRESGSTYRPFYKTEILVPVVFGLLHAWQAFLSL
jgi:hypothetical protein